MESRSESSDSPSPSRVRQGGEREERDRPRFFDAKAKALCWQSADVVPGRHPERWRRDPAGNVVCKRFCNCHGCLCYEHDHIIPYSKGGESVAGNCQILQTRVNRYKKDKERVDEKELLGFSCDIKFTDKELDIIEMAVYGDVIRPGHECRCRTVAEMLGKVKSKKPVVACKLPYGEDKELDIIEMADYGDVIRPGHECHCRTVAKVLGKVKSKKPVAACKLPYKEGS